MNLTQVTKLVARSSKRVGRGIGSGKGGHTAGRGNKGQKARGKIPVSFEGTKFKKSLIKRLPLLRGKGKFKAWGDKYQAINLSRLEKWSAKMEVTQENLEKQGIAVPGKPVRILGGGEAPQSLTIKVSISKQAAEKVTKAGGTIASTV